MTFSFATVCVGRPYVDYFASIIKNYFDKNIPQSSNIYIHTDDPYYCGFKFKEYKNVKVIDFRTELAAYGITPFNYRDNDCIKVKSFLKTFYLDRNDILFYVDADMILHHYDENEFEKQFCNEGFYYELCHTYEEEKDIEEHTMKRVRQIKEIGFPLQFMKKDNKIIFPIERYWGLKRTFDQKEKVFMNEFAHLFDLLMRNGMKDDLYTETVEIGHCVSKAFGDSNSLISNGLTFMETSGATGELR